MILGLLLSIAMQLALILIKDALLVRLARLCLYSIAFFYGALLVQIVLNALLPRPPHCG